MAMFVTLISLCSITFYTQKGNTSSIYKKASRIPNGTHGNMQHMETFSYQFSGPIECLHSRTDNFTLKNVFAHSTRLNITCCTALLSGWPRTSFCSVRDIRRNPLLANVKLIHHLNTTPGLGGKQQNYGK